ncbi:uncharacterized protein LOC115695027 [Cannabis sativa]|uniref:uncharacterized protein LOC115695027 n=1 Tax=Cannabis sativa TaxID=3483 RepID=UPI0011DF2B69|nr:uncharacterized protein LOC115695027 [Cannabis sativa]
MGTTLNVDQQIHLIKPFTSFDVKKALFSILDLKSTCPDGFGSKIFKAFWADIVLLYKCISKMMCSRMANVLPSLVNRYQGVFIKNRSITHNMLILQDLLHGFINWIMTRLRGSTYSLVLNGRVHRRFQGKSGLRQRDPLSPLPFVLVMEYLTRLLLFDARGLDFKYHPMCKSLKIVSPCIADDLILFCKGTVKSIQRRKIKSLLAQQKLLRVLNDPIEWPEGTTKIQQEEYLETTTGIMIFNLSDAIIRLIDKEKTPAQIWKKLEE